MSVAPLLVTLLVDALEAEDFAAFRRLLPHTGLSRAQLQPLHRLAHAGQLLLDLDLEDLDRPPGVPEPLRSRLREVALPQRPGAEPAGVLASLRPTVALLLELVAVHHRRRDVDALLVAVHLLSECLPLLAWEDVLGHGGDPARLRRQVEVAGSLWGRPACPAGGPGARAARDLEGATRDEAAWQEFLERSWSNLGVQLADCGRCRADCAVARLATPAQPARLALADAFARSELVGLRHGSTVGHALAVPTREAVDRAWSASRARLGARSALVLAEDQHPLPGLAALCGAVSGRPLRTGTLVAETRAAALDALEALVRSARSAAHDVLPAPAGPGAVRPQQHHDAVSTAARATRGSQ